MSRFATASRAVLVIAPHPDDESIGMGGTIALHVNAGDLVNVLFLTSGDAGIADKTAEEAMDIREAEAAAACATLGTAPPLFWRQPDGQLDGFDEDLIIRLRELIRDLDPAVVYVTHYEDAHVDHTAAHQLLVLALKGYYPPHADLEALPLVLEYEVWTPMPRPTKLVDISDPAVLDLKQLAIASHVSQNTPSQQFAVAALALNRYRGELHNRPHGPYAEAFTRMKGTGNLKLTIVFLTYAPAVDHPRAESARACLEALLTHLQYSDDVHLHIADDGSDPLHVTALMDIAGGFGFVPTVSNAERGGYGKSYNIAAQAVHGFSDYIMPFEDDWLLNRDLNLDPIVEAIEASEGRIKCVRLGYLGYTNPIRGEVVKYPWEGGQTFLLLDPESTEHHVFAGHPRVETIAFERELGAWPEGIGAGATELEVCGRPVSRVGIAWPMDMGMNASQDYAPLFSHIGEHIGDAPLRVPDDHDAVAQ